MSIESISTALAKQLTVPRVRAYSLRDTPDAPSIPCLVQILGAVDYDVTLGGDNYDFTIRLQLLIAQQDKPSNFRTLLPIVEATGDSIRGLVHADFTLDGACSFAKVERFLGAAIIAWGGVNYLGGEWEIGVRA